MQAAMLCAKSKYDRNRRIGMKCRRPSLGGERRNQINEFGFSKAKTAGKER